MLVLCMFALTACSSGEALPNEEFYQEALGLMGGEMIYKDYRSYHLGRYILEVCHVDPGTPWEFMYGEIEFESEEEACAFRKPEYLGEEVTELPCYKMKNYWNETRLKCMP